MLKNILIDGLNVQYEEAGSGYCIILLHGWGCSLDIFKQLQSTLSVNFRVISIDFPGFGKSDVPGEVWGVYEYTIFFEKFVATLQLKGFALLGHSFGGRVAIVYASRNKNLDKLILVDSAGIKPKRSFKYYIKVYSFKMVKNILSVFLPQKYFTAVIDRYRKKVGSSDYNNVSGMMRAIFTKVVNEDLKLELSCIKVPTLLIWGKADTATPIQDAYLMNKLIPDSGLVEFEDVGHYSFLEKAFDVQVIIDNFLKH